MSENFQFSEEVLKYYQHAIQDYFERHNQFLKTFDHALQKMEEDKEKRDFVSQSLFLNIINELLITLLHLSPEEKRRENIDLLLQNSFEGFNKRIQNSNEDNS